MFGSIGSSGAHVVCGSRTRRHTAVSTAEREFIEDGIVRRASIEKTQGGDDRQRTVVCLCLIIHHRRLGMRATSRGATSLDGLSVATARSCRLHSRSASSRWTAASRPIGGAADGLRLGRIIVEGARHPAGLSRARRSQTLGYGRRVIALGGASRTSCWAAGVGHEIGGRRAGHEGSVNTSARSARFSARFSSRSWWSDPGSGRAVY